MIPLILLGLCLLLVLIPLIRPYVMNPGAPGAGMIAVVVGALALLVAGVGYITGARGEKHRRERDKTISIVYLPDSTKAIQERIEATSDTLITMWFEVCNNGTDTVSKVSFYPKTLRRGSPTKYGVVVHSTGRPDSTDRFTLNYVIAPGKCTTMSWLYQKYIVLDTVIAESTRVSVGPTW